MTVIRNPIQQDPPLDIETDLFLVAIPGPPARERDIGGRDDEPRVLDQRRPGRLPRRVVPVCDLKVVRVSGHATVD